jgi:lysophospholipase L1-like esterase
METLEREEKTDRVRRLSRKRRVAYVAVLYVGFLGLLGLIEAGTRLTLPYVSSLELFVTARQQQQQVANEKQSGIFEGDPLLLWRLKPNLDQVVWDFTVLSTNSDHLRAEHSSDSLQPKQPGAIRIVCLGDSVTFGFRVPAVWPNKPTEYDREWLPFPMLLEKELRAANANRAIDVVTMAVPGYTSHQGLAWLQRDLDKLQPDLLIVSFGWNDASFSDVPDRESVRTDWSTVGSRWLMEHSQAFAHATRWLRNRTTTAPASRVVGPAPRVSQQEYLNNLDAIEKLARSRGAQVIVVAAPYRDRSPEAAEADLMQQYRLALGTMMRQQNIPFLEVRELTEEAYPSNEGWFGERIHPNHMGHRLIASELLKLIRSSRALDELQVPDLIP